MQTVSLILISIISFSIFVLSVNHVRKKVKIVKLKNYDLIIFLISLLFLGFSIFSTICAINFKNFNINNFIAGLSILILAQSTLLIFMLSKIQKNKNILHPIAFLLLALIPTIINPQIIHISIPVSFLVLIMTFLSFTEDHKSHIPTLIIYSSVSIIFYIFSFISKNLILLFTIISFSIFLIFMQELSKFLMTKKDVYIRQNKKSNSRIIPFLRHLIFVIIITNFVFLGTVTIHELGHATSAHFANCENSKIVYELNGLPHTEINCENDSKTNLLILSGIFLPLLIALLLIFANGTSIKEISLEIIGFNLMISYLDFQNLGASKTFATSISIIGGILTILGLTLLVKSRTD